MNECRRIEPLLYLYRAGELTDLERSKVVAHTGICPRCKRILQELLSVDAALGLVRESVPDLPVGSFPVDRVLDHIAAQRREKSRTTGKTSPIDEFLYWLRPALSVGVAAAVVFLFAQQTRDAMMMANLESRLRTYGDAAREETSPMSSAASLLAEVASVRGKQGESLAFPPANAAIDGNPVGVLGHDLIGLFHHDEGLLEELSRRYPHLAEVRLDDGIDERERKILDTEGKAFLKEF